MNGAIDSEHGSRATKPVDSLEMPPIRIGLAGAGRWASAVHANLLSAHPAVRFTGVWSRTLESANRLAEEYGVAAYPTLDALIEVSEAIVIAVPPAAQPEIAAQTVGAGRHVMLEKPLAPTLDEARRLCAAIERAGVGSVMALTFRFTSGVQKMISDCVGQIPDSAHCAFVVPASPAEGGWRSNGGPLLDLGPHVVDLLDAAIGPVRAIYAATTNSGVSMALHHGSVTSHATLDYTRHNRFAFVVNLVMRGQPIDFEPPLEMRGFYYQGSSQSPAPPSSYGPFVALLQEFVDACRGRSSHLGARRGLEIQAVLDAASQSVASGCVVAINRDLAIGSLK